MCRGADVSSREKWYRCTVGGKVPPMIDAERTIGRYRKGVLRWFVSRLSNGLGDDSNSLAQVVKVRASSYSSFRNLRKAIDLIAGKLEPRPIHLSSRRGV
ncbi:MAG: transposase [Thermoanaerobaculia bacterium]